MALSISFSLWSRVWVMSLASIPRLVASRAPGQPAVERNRARLFRAPTLWNVEIFSSAKLRTSDRLHGAHGAEAILARPLRAVQRAVGRVHQVLRRLHVLRRVVRQAQAGGHPGRLSRLV